ncbi:MAG: choice-of-anchor Q domain-containing protein, partial [Thermoanaerobaculum sp.]
MAATFYANDTGDPNPVTTNCSSSTNTDCSLRAAIIAANAAGPGLHTIVLQTGATYNLSWDNDGGGHATDSGADNDDLDITADITIQGNGATIQRSGGCTLDSIAATGEFRIFEVHSGAALTLQNVTVQNGCADGPIAPNDQSGGAIWNSGTLTVTQSTISGNSARQDGGGILNGGTATLTNSTISGNSASFGSGILNSGGATLNASFITVANNTLGNGIDNFNLSTVNIKNSIVANHAPQQDCANASRATFNSQGGNFASDNTCPGFTQSSSLNLQPLANNGGPTQTHALGPGSAAIDAVSDCTDLNTNSVNQDQRGVSRPQGFQCDAGAFEAGA